MKRILSLILIFVIALCSISFASCKNKETSEISIFVPFNKIERFEQAEINLLPGINGEEVKWFSENTELLKVKNGVVEAVATGKTKIIAKYKDFIQAQEVKIVKSEESPQISLNDISILLATSIKLQPKLIYSGRVIDSASFVITSNNTAIVSVDKLNVVANSYGTTDIVVDAYINEEKIATKTVSCKVTDDSGIIPNMSLYELYVTGQVKGIDFITEINLDADVIVGGQKVEQPNIEWVIEDQSIAKIEGGKLKAVGLGKTFVIGTYLQEGLTLKTIKLPVEVKTSIVEDVGGVIPDVIMDMNKSIQQLDSIAILGEDCLLGSIQSDDGKINKVMDNNSLKTADLISGEYSCIVYSSDKKIGAKVNLHIADYVVYDYESLLEVSNPTNVSGYTVLADNVDCGSKGYVNNYTKAKGTTFTGVFNGLGHTISNFGAPYGGTGLYIDSSSGTFKNLAVTGLKLDTYNCAALCYRNVEGGETKVDNVYVEAVCSGISDSKFAAGICAFNWKGSVKITNTIVRVEGVYTEDVGAFIARANEVISITNSFAIGDFLVASKVSNSTNSKFDAINMQTNVKYDNDNQFATERYKDNSKIELNGFNYYWDLSCDVPCFRTA